MFCVARRFHGRTARTCHRAVDRFHVSVQSRRRFVHQGQVPAAVVNFNKVELAFQSKKTSELARAYFVLRLCSFNLIVENAEKLLVLSNKVFGETITTFLLKKTFFGQFCAAEDEKGLIPVMSKLEDAGISGILDYAAESDLDASRDDRDEFVSARTYEYEGERACDQSVEVFKDCIRTAAKVAELTHTGSRPFAAIKVTALGNPKLLKRLNEFIVESTRFFHRMEAKLERETVGYLTLEEFRKAFAIYFDVPEDKRDEIDDLFWNAIGDGSRRKEDARLDIIDWSRSMHIGIVTRLLRYCKTPGILYSLKPSEEELELAQKLFERLESLAMLAAESNVSLMIDAEQTYFQSCIDANILRLQKKYNSKGKTTIFGTYQCYLKSTDLRIVQDLERSKREGWTFAAKLVRGAYMISERKLAKEHGYESPIFETIEGTHACYHRNLDLLLKDNKAEVMVASHNQKTCEFALAKMKEYDLPKTGKVHFAQLLGMADHLTYALGANKYSVFKYLPYGKVHEVLPYLIRRAQENSGLMAGAIHERQVIWNEIMRRMR